VLAAPPLVTYSKATLKQARPSSARSAEVSHLPAVHLGLRETAGRHPAAPQEAHQIVRSINVGQDQGVARHHSKKADAAFDEAGDVIKGYGREANALAHEASGKILETSHETKVPVVQNGQAHMSIAPLSVTEPRKKVVDFVVYSNSRICMFGKADNPKLADVKSVDDLNRPDVSIAYFSGAVEESWVPKRFPKAQSRGVSGSGTAAPVEEIMAGRSDVAPIDKISWVTLNKQVPGLKSWPQGEACLTSTEFSNPVGLAVPKGDDVFLKWARAVADELKTTLQQEELRLIKEGEGS
jgi:Bacterial extracellular solute-binding proteins, family 3